MKESNHHVNDVELNNPPSDREWGVLGQRAWGGEESFYHARLIAARRAKGLTAQQLAEQIDTPSQFIYHLEELRQFPSSQRASKIGQLLGVNPRLLFPGYLRVIVNDKRHQLKVQRYLEEVEVMESDLGEDAFYQALEVWANEAPGSYTIDPASNLELRYRSASVRRMVEKLPKNQKDVIKRLFGLGRPAQRNQEVAKDLGITEQGVYELKDAALRRMRRSALLWSLNREF